MTSAPRPERRVGGPGSDPALFVGARLAPAKLNLALRVLGRRAEGFHEIESVMVTLPWGDDVGLRVAAGAADRLRLQQQGETQGVPRDDTNLAVRAARAVLGHVAERPALDVDIDLVKRVPPGAGLGGGSSDAAAVIALLGEALHVPPAEQGEIAASLGSDIPFLLQGGAAVVRGRGEQVEVLPSPRVPSVVLVLPPFGCSTAAVYARCAERVRNVPASAIPAAVAALASGSPAAWREAHGNDLAFAALRVEPRLKDLAREVEVRLGRPPMLSGSGSTLYDVPDVGDEQAVLDALQGLPARVLLVRG